MSRRSQELCIAPDHPALAGHFPGTPIVPGVMLLDEVLHALQLLTPTPISQWHIAAVKFHRVVRPNEPLQLTLEPPSDGATQFELRRGEQLIASGSVAPNVP